MRLRCAEYSIIVVIVFAAGVSRVICGATHPCKGRALAAWKNTLIFNSLSDMGLNRCNYTC